MKVIAILFAFALVPLFAEAKTIKAVPQRLILTGNETVTITATSSAGEVRLEERMGGTCYKHNPYLNARVESVGHETMTLTVTPRPHGKRGTCDIVFGNTKTRDLAPVFVTVK